ncbi:MAG: hypothetical protein WC797_04125 [Candidatus Paceibacterota bacterium]|jgi:hypothetical protein
MSFRRVSHRLSRSNLKPGKKYKCQQRQTASRKQTANQSHKGNRQERKRRLRAEIEKALSAAPTQEPRKKYASSYEERVVKILESRGIPFRYGVYFKTTNRFGKPNRREVDILLEAPLRVYWFPYPISAIEVKGKGLSPRAWWQRRELRNAGIITSVATEPFISFWEKYGFLRSEQPLPETTAEDATANGKQGNFEYNGQIYESVIHLTMAKILTDRKIPFVYKKVFATTKDDGTPNTRIVDFWLWHPIKVYWRTKPVQALQVKERLTPDVWVERRELRNAGVPTFIAHHGNVMFWRYHAFLRSEEITEDSNRR